MSRLIIKNLPSYVTPAKLREHFEQKKGPGGTLTDVKVSSKPDGTSRRFGFVGYKSDQEALAAQRWFDRTFVDSTRISVNVTEGAKDAPTPRPNKRRRIDDSSLDKPALTTGSTSTIGPTGSVVEPKPKGNAQLEEFMQVMKPRTGPAWANEATVQPTVSAPPTNDAAMQDVAQTPRQDDVSDLEWMKQRMSKNVDIIEKVFEQSDDEGDEREIHTKKTLASTEAPSSVKEPKDDTKETILQTSRLFVRNLAFSCTDEELADLFKPFGEISQIHSPLDSATKQRKGLAYVTFARPAQALEAYEALDKKSFQGRLLHILAAVDRKGKFEVVEGEGKKKKSVKDEKNAKRKSMAGKEFNWSMLYTNSDAVASSIADRMNISKSDILNPESGDNAAVKLALAETHIIQETKTYLESQGVLLSSFSSRARSDTTILVKNIPYGTTMDQIRELFEPYGELSRVLVPPAGTMAVVGFERPDEAAKGFRAVAYRRLGNSIIYLEKGPLGMFDENFILLTGKDDASSKSRQTISSAIRVAAPEHSIADISKPVDDDQDVSILQHGTTTTTTTTLYLKNLAFSTTQDRLVSVFQHLPSFAFARVQTKADPKRPPSGRLSMGYGFIGFKDREAAKKALKSIHGFVLDGHSLHVSFAGRGAAADEPDYSTTSSSTTTTTTKSRTTTKMIVKNVPFEATKKDVRDLFGSHGQLKSVRLPKKFDSRSRGFAFLEFTSRHEADNAYTALRHTHLLGRHLVLEWAEEAEQDVDVLRKKAGVGFGGGRSGSGAKDIPGRKRKLDLSLGGKKEGEEEEDVD